MYMNLPERLAEFPCRHKWLFWSNFLLLFTLATLFALFRHLSRLSESYTESP